MATRTIAGSSVGFTAHHIVRHDDQTGAIVPIRIFGRWVYIQKCVRAEQSGGIVIPEKTRDDTVFGLILAVGEKCGQWEDPKRARFKGMRGWTPQVQMTGEPLDKCIVPDDSEWGMMASSYGNSNCYGNSEMFVHECLIVATFKA